MNKWETKRATIETQLADNRQRGEKLETQWETKWETSGGIKWETSWET